MRTVLFAIGILLSTACFAEFRELFWEDLIPQNYSLPETFVDHANPMAQQNLDAPVVSSLDGQKVKLPGFIVPLEGDGKLTTEFLLVPYFGACIHVPPPPPNQIVYVRFSNGVPIPNLDDPIWVYGDLSTQTWQGDIASVGYSLTGLKIAPFEG